MERFQFQNKKEKDYFEGWYFRYTTDNINYAVIFAVSKNTTDPHSFIQVFDESDEACLYLRYDVADFSYDFEKHEVKISSNILGVNRVFVRSDKLSLDLTFTDCVGLDKFNGPDSAMAYLKNAPLQCFQEVIYLEGKAEGLLNNVQTKGDIYIEKTYGNAFPSRWVWIQSSHSKKGNAISFSVGKIPVLFFKVNGFFCLLKVKGNLFRFSSPNFSRIKVKENKISIRKGKYKLQLFPEQNHPVKLVGPIKHGLMKSTVLESINSTMIIKLYHKNKLILEDEFINVGYEMMY